MNDRRYVILVLDINDVYFVDGSIDTFRNLMKVYKW